MGTWILESTLAAGVLALLAWALSKRFPHRPALLHLAWLVVMIRLVLPPIPLGLPVSLDLGRVGQWFEARADRGGKLLAESPKAGLVDEGRRAQSIQSEPLLSVQTDPPSATKTIPSAAATIQPKPVLAAQLRDLKAAPQIQDQRSKAAGHTALPPESAKQPSGGSELAEKKVSPFHFFSTGFLLFGVWFLGAFLVLGVHLRQLIHMRRGLKRLPFAGIQLLDEVTERARVMGVKTPPVLVGRKGTTPFVWCWGGAYLVWPENLTPPSAHAGGREVLAHELAHLKRRDHWVIWLEWLCMLALWWHPLFWLARGRVRFYAELACDAMVVDHFPAQRKQYALALVETLRRLQPLRVWSGALGMGAHHEKEFEKRLGVIMNRKTSSRKPWIGVLALTVMGVLLFPAVTPSPEPAPAQQGLHAELGFLPIGLQDRVRARAALVAAKRYYHAERWSEAATLLAPATKQNPEDSHLWSLYGKTLRELGRYSEALAAFQRQRDLNDNPAWAEWNMAGVYALSGDSGSAISTLEKLLASGSINAEKLGSRTFSGLSDHARFGKITASALRYKNLKDEVWQHLGDKEYAKAESLLQEMFEIAPESHWVWEKLGFAHFYLGDLTRAEGEFQKAHELAPHQSHIVYNQGCVAAALNQKDRGMAYLRKALEMGFDNFELLSEDPDLDPLRELPAFKQLFEQAKLEEELGHRLKKAKKRGSTEDVMALLREAETLVTLDDHDRQHISKTIGLTQLRAGRFEAAVTAFTDALASEKDGHLKNGLYNLACALAGAGRDDDAMAALSASVAVGFHDGSHMAEDDDLASLRGNARFQEIVTQAGRAHLLAKYDAVDWSSFETWVRSGLQGREFDKKKLSKLAKRLYHGRAWSLGAEAYGQLSEREGGRTAPYNAACCYALAGDLDEAMLWLEKAVDAGFRDRGHMRKDSDLDNLRGDARFEALLESL